MNRIIFEKVSKYADYLYSLGQPYDYIHNTSEYACVNVDEETLCILALKFVVWRHTLNDGSDVMADMPSFVCVDEL